MRNASRKYQVFGGDKALKNRWLFTRLLSLTPRLWKLGRRSSTALPESRRRTVECEPYRNFFCVLAADFQQV